MKKRRTTRRRKTTKKYIYGRGVTRPYVNKRIRLMLGSGKVKKNGKQKGGFIPLSFLSAVAPTAINLIGEVLGKCQKEEIE